MQIVAETRRQLVPGGEMDSCGQQSGVRVERWNHNPNPLNRTRSGVREASAAGSPRRSRSPELKRRSAMSVVDQLQQATDGAATMIAALRPEELALPTPNEGWDVRAMLNHMIV